MNILSFFQENKLEDESNDEEECDKMCQLLIEMTKLVALVEDQYKSKIDEYFDKLKANIETLTVIFTNGFQMVSLFDYKDLKYNGYRSIFKIIKKCMQHISSNLIKLLNSLSIDRMKYEKKSKEYIQFLFHLTFMAKHLFQLMIVQKNNKSLSLQKQDHEDIYSTIIDSYDLLESDVFYGQCLGFYMCKPCQMIAKVFCSIELGMGQAMSLPKSNVEVFMSTVINSAQSWWMEHKRGTQMASLFRQATVKFCKQFWNLVDHPILISSSHLVLPNLKVIKSITLQPILLLMSSVSDPDKSVEESPPTDNEGSADVKIRLLSKTRRRWHKVCAHHVDEVWPGGFFCPGCEANRACPRPTNVLCSARLPECALSRHIEGRIDSWIAEHTGSGADHIAKVVVRVLSDCPKQVDIKPEMRRAFVETGEMPETIPYRLKAIFAFQQQGPGCQDNYGEQGEICLFGMHCQEYGPDCPGANARRIYLAYLDSVQFFEPAALRTEFYHRILTAYLEYCRDVGFMWAHIWACPPGDGDDYIFHMHPPSQKVPKPKRLQDWYIGMLDRAIQEGVIVDYCDIFSFSYNSQLTSLAEVPYFEGDYWPTIMEDLLKEDADAAAAAALACATNGLTISLATSDETSPRNREGTNDHDIVVISNGVGGAVTKKRKHKKLSNGNSSGPHQSKRRRHSAPTDQAVGDTPVAGATGNDTMKRLFELMEKRKENFFVVRLLDRVSAASAVTMGDENDESLALTTAVATGADLMDGRDKFLCLSRDKHLEFSSWRRARFATLVLCYELHLEARHGVICSCNRCGLLLLEPSAVRFECVRCHEYEVCESCASLPGVHRHPLHRVEVAGAVSLGTSPTLAVTNSAAGDANLLHDNGNGTQTGMSTVSSNSETGAVTVASSSSTAKTNGAPGERAVIDDATRLRNLVIAAGMFEHALRCRDACCKTQKCSIWRGFVSHLRHCTIGNGSAGSCKTCTKLAPLVAFHHKKYGNAGGHGNGYVNSSLPVFSSNNQQARLWQLQSERRRMQSATVAMAQAASGTPSGGGVVRSAQGNHLQSQQQQQHPSSGFKQQQPIIACNTGSPVDVGSYQRDLMTIRSYLTRLREGGASSQDVSRSFSQFLASQPRYLHVWRRYQAEMQQRQHQQQHIGTVASATPNAVMPVEPAGPQHQYLQQQQYQQHQHPHLQGSNYRIVQRPPPPNATVLNSNQSQYYMVQGRPPQLGHGYIATVANNSSAAPPNFSTSPRFSTYPPAGHPGYGPIFNPTQPPPSLVPQAPQSIYYHQQVASSPVATVPANTHFHSHNTPS